MRKQARTSWIEILQMRYECMESVFLFIGQEIVNCRTKKEKAVEKRKLKQRNEKKSLDKLLYWTRSWKTLCYILKKGITVVFSNGDYPCFQQHKSKTVGSKHENRIIIYFLMNHENIRYYLAQSELWWTIICDYDNLSKWNGYLVTSNGNEAHNCFIQVWWLTPLIENLLDLVWHLGMEECCSFFHQVWCSVKEILQEMVHTLGPSRP